MQYMKSQKYLTFLNENYFKEKGFIKIESKMKKKKFRQYRSNQGKSPKHMEKTYKMLYWSLLGLIFSLILIFLTK